MSNPHLLPRKATMDNIFALMEEVRNRPNAREEEIGKWVKELDRSKQALVEWGLVSDGGGRLSLTKEGEAIAWSSGRERDDLLLQHVVLGYEPYAVVVSHHLVDWADSLTTDQVLPTWARNVGIQLGKGEMSSAAATMFGIMDRAGLGKYIIGRGGKSTRIEFAPDAQERIRAAKQMARPRPNAADETTSSVEDTMKAEEPPEQAPRAPRQNQPVATAPRGREYDPRLRDLFARLPSGGQEEAEAGFEVYRRPGLEIKIRPTRENIARGIKFIRMLEAETPDMDESSDIEN